MKYQKYILQQLRAMIGKPYNYKGKKIIIEDFSVDSKFVNKRPILLLLRGGTKLRIDNCAMFVKSCVPAEMFDKKVLKEGIDTRLLDKTLTRNLKRLSTAEHTHGLERELVVLNKSINTLLKIAVIKTRTS